MRRERAENTFFDCIAAFLKFTRKTLMISRTGLKLASEHVMLAKKHMKLFMKLEVAEVTGI